MTPQPLPPSSPRLRGHRYEANVLGSKNERGAYPSIALARFVTLGGAKLWADETYPDAERVNVTYYSARSGWVPTPAAQRTAEGWTA